MISETERGNYDLAMDLGDKAFEYSLIEEPEYKEGWKVFFIYRKTQILVLYKQDLEAGEAFLNQFSVVKEDHPDYVLYWLAQLINLKGVVYTELGDFEKSKEMFIRAYDISSETKESEIAYYMYMSKMYAQTNQLDSADLFSKKLISKLKLKGDTLNGYYYNNLLTQATILAELGKHEKADELLEKIMLHYGGFLNKKNYNTRFTVLLKMANIKAQSEDYLSALRLGKESEQNFIKLHGKNNYGYCALVHPLGYYHYKLNQMDSTYLRMIEIPKLIRNHAQEKMYSLSLRGKEIFINRNSSIANNSLFMLEYFNNKYLDYNAELYDFILAQKRSTLQSVDKLKNYLKSDEISKQNFVSWQKKRSDYFNWLTTHAVAHDSSKILAAELEVQESALFIKAGLEYLDDNQTVNWKNVSEKLPNKSLAIEFLRYNHLETKENVYGALLLSEEYTHPIFVKLCKESDLKSVLKHNFAETDYEYTQRAYNSNTFYNLIWKPLEPYLLDTKDCYVSLSGLLYKIALDATFPSYSAIHPNIHLVHSTATLTKKAPSLYKKPTINLYGGVVYSLNSVKTIDSLSVKISENVHSVHRGLEGHHWSYLKGSEKEVKEISRLLKKNGYQVKLNLGIDCSENILKTELKNNSPNILHIATHGYYPVTSDSVLSYTQTASYARSGLVMAGANTSKTRKASIQNFGDGILTAPEITSLSIPNTQLVVLSACESGKGTVSHVDEVYGLQRAFKVAGAHYVIYTLWKIPDEPTKDFMVYFYKKLSEGNTIEQSFFLTKRHMKKTQPVYHWAGFQLIK